MFSKRIVGKDGQNYIVAVLATSEEEANQFIDARDKSRIYVFLEKEKIPSVELTE